MEKEQSIDDESGRLILNQTRDSNVNGTSKRLLGRGGLGNGTSKPYRRSRKLSRYNNALKNLIPIRLDEKSTENRERSMPVDSAGLYSTIFGGWLTGYLWKAYLGGGMTMSDLPTISPYDCCEYNVQRLEILWNEEVTKDGIEGASFGKAAWRFVRTRTLVSCFLLSISLLLGFLSPVLVMRRLLEFVESPDGTLGEGIKWALILALCDFVRILFLTWSWIHNNRTALRLKNAYLGMLYKKIIKTNDFGSKSSGKLINMISNDGQRLFDVCLFGPTLIGGPIVSICGFIYIIRILSPMALLGMLTFFLFYPIQYGISRLNGYFKSRGVKISDQRISGVNEIFDCIKLIKMYAWEEPFRLRLLELRKKEENSLHKIAYARSVGISLSPMIPVISLIVTVLAHVAGGNNLTAAQAFPITSFFVNQMKMSLTSFREATRFYIDCAISFRRFKVFPLVMLFNTQIRHMFSYVEVSISNIIDARISCSRFKSMLVMEDGRYYVHKPILKTQALSIINGTFTCDTTVNEGTSSAKNSKDRKSSTNADYDNSRNVKRDILKEITFEARKGKLIGICGHVASGKTSLLLGLLGQLRLKSGQLSRDGSCAYVSQQAWILNATFRENIIFGEIYDEERYNTVIELSCLGQDINAFPTTHDTEIGERGINLSGGQKQRVALARALYADRDIYFLDDPLSAVDAQVGAFIFDNYIQGALKEKTVLFVTHQIQYLSRCDEIYMMSNGQIVEHGVHERLMTDTNSKYAVMVKSMMSLDKQTSSDISDNADVQNMEKSENEPDNKVADMANEKIDQLEPGGTANASGTGAAIMVPDNVETGTIKAQTYYTYIQAAGGYCVGFLIMIIFTLNVGSTAFSTWWLAHWIKAGRGDDEGRETIGNATNSILNNPDLIYYESIYGSCIVAILLTSAIRGLAIAGATIRASTTLHNRIFTKILRAPMEFFETTPRGRIQNIFSRDTDEIDVQLPISLEGALQSGLSCIISLSFICAVFPWFIVAIAFLGILFYYIGKVFRVALRDLKRFENNTRSPIFSFATASVQGLDTIHAFDKETDFIKQFQAYLDTNGAYQYLCSIAMRWLAVRYDSLAGIATGTTGLFVVFFKGQVPPALAGLALAYSGQMSGIFQYTMRLFSETELRFISVERINHYLRTLINENDATSQLMNEKKSLESMSGWPQNGEIEFKDVDLRYRKHLPKALNRVSFRIGANEKIGIVGRTGSGKSSIIVALFRIVELSHGSIKIDGIDVSKIDMKRLRGNISIIPQDPVLFNRSLRFNLDPNSDNSDAELWFVLEKTQLKEKVQAMPGQLDAIIHTGGSNLSMGERQLLCLARALLRKNKILVLDEATAAVDPETEAIVQMTIQREFTNCTILTIAHRLQTVLSCDRILVMDSSNIIEFDSPSKLLLENSNSRFSKMMNAAINSHNHGSLK